MGALIAGVTLLGSFTVRGAEGLGARSSLLLVASEGKSGRAMLRGAKEILAEMNLLGVVLNRSKERNESAYY